MSLIGHMVAGAEMGDVGGCISNNGGVEKDLGNGIVGVEFLIVDDLSGLLVLSPSNESVNGQGFADEAVNYFC